MQKQLEIACFNLQSAIVAQLNGANRIELCEDYKAGGVTPSSDLIEEVLKNVSIPVFVMIRPRAGNFVYNQDEIHIIKSQIEYCKSIFCKGLVFGVITNDNQVNLPVCKELVQMAYPLECTFHRAFDEISDNYSAIEDVIACGFKRILTSGQAKTAIEGKDVIKELFRLSKNRISIMPGGNIRSGNIKALAEFTGASEFHSAAITSRGETADPFEIKKLLQELKN